MSKAKSPDAQAGSVTLTISEAERLDRAIGLALQRLGNAAQGGLSEKAAAAALAELNRAYSPLANRLKGLADCGPADEDPDAAMYAHVFQTVFHVRSALPEQEDLPPAAVLAALRGHVANLDEDDILVATKFRATLCTRKAAEDRPQTDKQRGEQGGEEDEEEGAPRP